MQFNIVNVSGGSFKNEDGQNVAYGSVYVIDEEVTRRDGFAGQEIKKIRCNPDLIGHIGTLVPGLFDCQIDIVGKDSRIKIVSAKLVDKKAKVA